MKVDEVIKALRCCCSSPRADKCKAECIFYRNDLDMSKCIGSMGENAADLLEQQQVEIKATTKDRDQWKRAAEASRDVIQPKLRAEIEELKAENEKLKPFDKMREFVMFSSPEEMQKYCVYIQSLNDKLKTENKQLKESQPVRCKDCVKRKTEDCSMYYECECGEQHTWEVDDDYCSVGKRRVEE